MAKIKPEKYTTYLVTGYLFVDLQIYQHDGTEERCGIRKELEYCKVMT